MADDLPTWRRRWRYVWRGAVLLSLVILAVETGLAVARWHAAEGGLRFSAATPSRQSLRIPLLGRVKFASWEVDRYLNLPFVVRNIDGEYVLERSRDWDEWLLRDEQGKLIEDQGGGLTLHESVVATGGMDYQRAERGLLVPTRMDEHICIAFRWRDEPINEVDIPALVNEVFQQRHSSDWRRPEIDLSELVFSPLEWRPQPSEEMFSRLASAPVTDWTYKEQNWKSVDGKRKQVVTIRPMSGKNWVSIHDKPIRSGYVRAALAGISFVIALVFFARGGAYILRRLRRSRRKKCLECGYSLVGISADRCPECGTARSVRSSREQRSLN